jgi:hypothetical protein
VLPFPSLQSRRCLLLLITYSDFERRSEKDRERERERERETNIDGVRVLADHGGPAEVAELVSAMAGGWNAQLIVEAPYVPSEASSSSSSSDASTQSPAATSLALAVAAHSTGGRYACVLPDAGALQPPALVVRDAEAAMAQLEGVDLLVVDARRRDAAAVLCAARPGPRGMVVVRHGDSRRRGATALAASMGAGTRVVRSVYLPIGKGVEVLHVGVGRGPSLQTGRSGGAGRRWIRHFNHDTGEEHVFRRQ